MSLQTLRINKKKKNQFLSNCFQFDWLGKFSVDIHFTETVITVNCVNFYLYKDNDIFNAVSKFQTIQSHSFYTPKEAIDFFKLVVYTLVNDLDVKSNTDFYEDLYNFNRTSGTIEWLPKLHPFIK